MDVSHRCPSSSCCSRSGSCIDLSKDGYYFSASIGARFHQLKQPFPRWLASLTTASLTTASLTTASLTTASQGVLVTASPTKRTKVSSTSLSAPPPPTKPKTAFNLFSSHMRSNLQSKVRLENESNSSTVTVFRKGPSSCCTTTIYYFSASYRRSLSSTNATLSTVARFAHHRFARHRFARRRALPAASALRR